MNSPQWNPYNINRLCYYIMEGKTLSEIAEWMGMSKNAVIYEIRRLRETGSVLPFSKFFKTVCDKPHRQPEHKVGYTFFVRRNDGVHVIKIVALEDVPKMLGLLKKGPQYPCDRHCFFGSNDICMKPAGMEHCCRINRSDRRNICFIDTKPYGINNFFGDKCEKTDK